MKHKIYHSQIFILLAAITIIGSFAFDSARAMEPLDEKYENAIQICRAHLDRRILDDEVSSNYENAMKICGADNYRRYPGTIWALNIYNTLDVTQYQSSTSYQSLISVELHHVAGDMMHIAQLEKDKSYRNKVKSAMEYEFKERWFEEKTGGKHYTTSELVNMRIPYMPDEYGNSNGDMCDAFIKMIGFFKRWDELQKNLSIDDLRTFHGEIKGKYDNHYAKVYWYEPYAKLSLLKYRLQRNLSLYWHPTYYSVYQNSAYRAAEARNSEAEAKKRKEQEIWVNNFRIQHPKLPTGPAFNLHGNCYSPVCQARHPRNCPCGAQT